MKKNPNNTINLIGVLTNNPEVHGKTADFTIKVDDQHIGIITEGTNTELVYNNLVRGCKVALEGELLEGTVIAHEILMLTSNEERKAKKRLEQLRIELRREMISYGELAELQSLVQYIEKDDVELLEAAGVPENKD